MNKDELKKDLQQETVAELSRDILALGRVLQKMEDGQMACILDQKEGLQEMLSLTRQELSRKRG